jgi:hypothetical protein
MICFVLLHDLWSSQRCSADPNLPVLAKTIVAKRTVKGLRGVIAAMVYATQINADLHVRFVPAATIA